MPCPSAPIAATRCRVSGCSRIDRRRRLSRGCGHGRCPGNRTVKRVSPIIALTSAIRSSIWRRRVGGHRLEVVGVDLLRRGSAPRLRRSGRRPRGSDRRCRRCRRPRRRRRAGTSPAASSPWWSGRDRAAPPPTARRPATGSSSGASQPGPSASSTSTAPQSASACRVVRSGQPIHHARSVVVPGPNRRSQCPASSLAATRGSSPAEPAGQPVLGGRVRVGPVDPAARPGPQHLPGEAQDGQHPGVGTLDGGVGLAGRQLQRVTERRAAAARPPGRCSARARAGRPAPVCSASASQASGSATPLAASICRVRRRSGSTRASVAAACIRRTTAGVAAHRVRRIAWCRISCRST